MKKILVVLIIVAGFAASCDVSERDISEPRLPRYSEKGLNTAGCMINDETWFDPCYFGFIFEQDDCDGLTVAYDTLLNYSEIRFNGGVDILDYEKRKPMTLVFKFPFLIQSTMDLNALVGSAHSINGTSVKADVLVNGESIIDCGEFETTQTGRIFFRSNGIANSICAGTFGYSTSSNCGKYDVWYGRFDYAIHPHDFVCLN